MGMLGTLLKHPDEFVSLLKMKALRRQHGKQIGKDPDFAFCFDMLQRVSRSFTIVILQLDSELRDAVCIFYLVLRALDTVEDDMSIPVDTKLPLLKTLHENISDTSWHFPCGQKDYKVLMDGFHHVAAAFLQLGKRYQDTIKDITARMGHGMAKFICKQVETIQDYDEYCHFVAGLVGLGLSNLFYAAKLEDLAPDSLSNSMGLLLQKTNIIRDYLEDINELPKPRMFWPQEIWGKYVSRLEDFKEKENTGLAVACLNEMITNALEHALDCLKYMATLHDPAIFRFCALPQIMAIGTLVTCYNNAEVFRGVVKIRQGLTAKIMNQTHQMADVYGAFYDFCRMLTAKIEKGDQCATQTLNCVAAIQHSCQASGVLSRRTLFVDSKPRHEFTLILAFLTLLLAVLYAMRK
eukprot:c26488_g1_i1 orf=421-1644(-)